MFTKRIRSFNCSDALPSCEIYPGPDIYQWNAVDVQNANGLLERGLVINTANHGLIVDFGVPGRRSERVPFKRALYCRTSPEHDFAPIQDWDAEHSAALGFHVLARMAADRPWTWYPAVCLVRRFLWNKHAYVRIQLGESAVTMFLSALVVRVARSDWRGSAVGAGDFVSQTSALPGEYRAGQLVEPALWSLWVETMVSQHDAYPVCAMNGRLVYLQKGCNNAKPARASGNPYLSPGSNTAKLSAISQDELDRMNGRAKACLARRLQAGWNYTEGRWKRAAPKIQSDINAELAHQSPEMGALLSLELQREVLSCFAANEGPFFRRVGPVWNAIFQQDDTNQHLILNCDNAGTATGSVGMCIIRQLTAATRMIILANVKQRWMFQEFTDCMRLISYVYKQRGNRLRKLQVVASGCRWDFGNHRFLTEVHMLARTCVTGAAAVECIVWHNCRFRGIGDQQYDCIVVRDVIAVHDSLLGMQTELYALVERNLFWKPEWIPLNVFGLMQWIANEARTDAISFTSAKIKGILGTYQCADPRPANQYRRKPDWTVEDLCQLDMTTLSTLTLWVLNLAMLYRAKGNR
ncbi:uncharacterized protein LOC129586056 [Paramacrobiotus metropolitanus]|uniref:uncharacterized protein LOC129586056 n=1 Tax=Paramacrobiotus metropolitanus TaxID=2943436 RepID=UPI002445DD17|nr:uncharacterized protein LOC129586056 [Paramacrobiotus metropolitanus]